MIRLATISLLFAAPLLAQTTWTSFEDRKGHAIASDPAGGVLMFGGESSTSAGEYLDDTNTFANPGATASWTQINPFSRPTARTEHAMASGSSTDDAAIFILFGGLAVPTTGGPAVPNGETFIYDGSGWGNGIVYTAGPSPRTGHTMLTDLIRNRVVLFGGLSGGFAQNDLWEFDPVNDVWISVIASAQPGSPPPRYDHSMAFHPGFGGTTSRIYLFGGTGFKFDTWEYDPTAQTWTNVTPAVRPSGRRRAAMSYLPAFDNIVLFGGQDNTLTALNDTWVWDRYAVPPTWTQSTPATSPPARWDHALAPDQLGNNAVLLGGDDGSGAPLEGTWLWSGVNWVEQLPPPSRRSEVGMAYDGNRDRHVVFGGRTVPGGTDLDETWELDGLNWRPRSPSTRPPARSLGIMGYDSNRNRTVLFGGMWGASCANLLNDTWEWDGNTWSPIVTATSPPPERATQLAFDSKRNVSWMLVGSGMWEYDGIDWSEHVFPGERSEFGYAWDSARGRLVVVGGDYQTPSGPYYGDTWEWDGSRWYEMATTGPSARQQAAMTYDSVRGECVLFGGYDGTAFGDTWLWDGVAWSQASGASARYKSGIAFDPSRDRSVLFGGQSALPGAFLFTTIEWNGSAWAAGISGNPPSGRTEMAMAFDPVADHVLMFGGRNDIGTDLGDIWSYDGTAWTDLTPASGPMPAGRRNSRLVHDPASGKMLLFGGNAVVTSLGDTWHWDGQAWTDVSPATAPAARYGHALVSTGSTVLLWGGDVAGTSAYAKPELWEWTGTDWMLIDSGSPSPRKKHGAAYDARRDRVVIFGGANFDCGSPPNIVYFNETWEWDGDSWLQRFPQNSPAPRERCRLAYDEARGRVVLFGGRDFTNVFGDTWEWDGDNWIARVPASSPPGTVDLGMSFDRQRKVTVTFGDNGTWEYGPINPANIEPFGTGCPGSNGIPSLEPKPWAGPWLGGQLEVDLINAPPGLGLFVWGYSETTWIGGSLPFSLAPFGGGPGCNLLVSDTIVQVFLSGTNPYLSFVLPNHPSFLGKVMRAQAGFLDTGMGGAPVVTHALRMTFGSK